MKFSFGFNIKLETANIYIHLTMQSCVLCQRNWKYCDVDGFYWNVVASQKISAPGLVYCINRKRRHVLHAIHDNAGCRSCDRWIPRGKDDMDIFLCAENGIWFSIHILPIRLNHSCCRYPCLDQVNPFKQKKNEENWILHLLHFQLYCRDNHTSFLLHDGALISLILYGNGKFGWNFWKWFLNCLTLDAIMGQPHGSHISAFMACCFL